MLVVVSAHKVGNFEAKILTPLQKEYRQLKKPSQLVKDTSLIITSI